MSTVGLGLGDAERERQLLTRIIDILASGLDLGPLVQEVATLITDATDTDVCFVHVLDPATDELVLSGATAPFDTLAGRVHLPVGQGVSGWVAAHAEPVVIVDDKRADPRYRYIPELRGEDYTSMASVPMVSRPGTLVGVLNVHTRRRREFGPQDVELLTSIGALVAGAVENARMHQALAERQQARERFAEHTIALQEAERRRLAAEIHDGISQRIVGLAFHLSAAQHAVVSDPQFARSQIVAALHLADEALEETRDAIAGLRPSVLDDLGLAAGLESLARSTPAVNTAVEIEIERALPEHVETALYRIAQEALQNVAKHADASSARITLRCTEGSLRLEVSDDGRGFTPGRGDGGPSVSYGLAGMRERAELIGGRLTVTGAPGAGTLVRVDVPLNPP